MTRNIHQRLSNFTTRLLSLLHNISGDATIRIGHGEVFLKES